MASGCSGLEPTVASSNSRTLSSQSLCSRTRSSTILLTKGSVRFASSTVKIFSMPSTLLGCQVAGQVRCLRFFRRFVRGDPLRRQQLARAEPLRLEGDIDLHAVSRDDRGWKKRAGLALQLDRES